MNFLWFIIIGALAGWIAGKIMKGRGFGILRNIIVGIIGGIIGGWVFEFLGISVGGIFGSLVTAVAGAVILLFFVGLIKEE